MEKEALILDGLAVAASIREKLAERVRALAAQGIVPCLATVLVGDDPSSAIYVRMKGNACGRLGIRSIRVDLPASTTTAELIAEIDQLNADPSIHGILLQHPVPRHIDERAAFEAIRIDKDVDYDACLAKAGAITPVPAGVGPVTIAMLLKHTVDAAEKFA